MHKADDVLVPGARHVVTPDGIVASAWPRIRNTCHNIGWTFDPWQDAIGRLILAKKANGQWASDLAIMSIPRQVGKSYLLGSVIFALCLLEPGLRVIWTSHHTATTEEMYESMKELAAHKRVKPLVVKCVALQGSRWRIQFVNGSRVDFGARSQGFGRGKAKVGVLVLDEFQHITGRALANLAPTTNTAENPLILCAGTPPGPEVSGEAFTMRRTAALDGLSNDSLYVEFSADEGGDPNDRRQWAKANPSFPKRTPERALLLLKKVLDEDDFRREALGVWDEISVHKPLVSPAQWKQMADVGPSDDVVPDALGLDMSHGRDISVGACWIEGESSHIEQVWAGSDPAWCVDWLVDVAGRRVPVVVDAASPAASLVPELKARKCQVVVTTAANMAQACGLLENRIGTGSLTHGSQKPVTDAILGARRRPIRDAGGWALDRSDPTSSIYPIVAATLALFGATTFKRTRSSGRVVVLS